MLRMLRLFVVVPVVLVLTLVATGYGSTDAGSRVAIVSVTADGGEVSSLDGRNRLPLPWLLPGDRDLDVSRDGRRVAFVSERDGNPEVYVADVRGGAAVRLTRSPRAADGTPVWSPDGERIAWASVVRGRSNVFVMNADGSARRRLVFGGGRITAPEWSPDGTSVAFGSDRDGFPGLWSAPVSGGPPVLLHHLRRPVDRISWRPDGAVIALGSSGDVLLFDVASASLSVLVGGPAADGEPDWSPEGATLVFARASRGQRTLLTVQASGGEPARIRGSGGRRSPRFARSTPWLLPPAEALVPDLDQRPPTDITVMKIEGRYALGFTSNVESVGEGALVIHGRRAAGEREMTATQIVETSRGGKIRFEPVGSLAFEPHAPHFHWHLQQFERYELRSVTRPSLVARDRKSGFCLIDRWGRAARNVKKQRKPRFVGDCGTAKPDARRVVEGSSPGYRDRYPAFFHGQDIEIEGLPAGRYVLVHRANPERLMRESDYSNNEASALVELSWPAGRKQSPVVEVLRSCETGTSCPPAAR